MKLSELIAGLNKLTQFAGDLPVVIKNVESEAETVLHSIGINIDPSSGTANGSVTINHGTAPEPAPEPAPAADQPADARNTDPNAGQ